MTRIRFEWFAGYPPKNYKEKKEMELIMPNIGRKKIKWNAGVPGK